MPRIQCHYLDCAHLDEGFCGAAAVEIDPDVGCMTYTPNPNLIENDDWDDDVDIDLEMDEWDELDFDEEDDYWLDDEDDF